MTRSDISMLDASMMFFRFEVDRSDFCSFLHRLEDGGPSDGDGGPGNGRMAGSL